VQPLSNSSGTGGAYTFNAAGLNPQTLNNYGGDFNKAKDKTEHWRYPTDPLTDMQGSYIGSYLLYPAVGHWEQTSRIDHSENPLHNHSIDTSIAALKKEINSICK